MVAISSARTRARDSKRISDLKQISTALEIYYADYTAYPSLITTGQPLVSQDGSKTYMAKVPKNPTPRAEGSCADLEYQYSAGNDNYSLIGCLSKAVGDVPAGARKIEKPGTPRDLGPTNGLVGWWPLDSVNGLKDLTGNWVDAVKNNAVLAVGCYGEVGGSYFLPGTGGYNGSMVFKNPIKLYTAATICFLVKRTTHHASGGIIDAMYPHTFRLSENISGDLKVGFGNGVGVDGTSVGSFTEPNVVGALVPDAWQQYCMAFNGAGTGKVQLCRNGTSLSNVVTAIDSLGNKDLFRMGLKSSSGVNFEGYITDARFYDHDLTLAEVSALYNATKP